MAGYREEELGLTWRFDPGGLLDEIGEAIGNLLDTVAGWFSGEVFPPPADPDPFVDSSQGTDASDGPDDVDSGEGSHANTWSDNELSQFLGIPAGTGRDELHGFDAAFAGASGAAFGALTGSAASEFGINPGLLGVNALAEALRGVYLSTSGVTTTSVGLDFWGSGLRANVVAAVPGAGSIPSTPTGTEFTNENGNNAGPVHEFPNGQQALRAMAATLRYGEMRMTAAVGQTAWNGIGAPVRFMILRLFFNAGPLRARQVAKEAAAGKDVLIRTGPAGPSHPRRTATIRSGQSIHVSQGTFGTVVAH